MFGETAPTIPMLAYAPISDPVIWIFVFLATLLFSVPLVWVVASAWESVNKLRLKAGLKQQVIALKQQMIEKGMTADEIVRVLGPSSEALDDLPEEVKDDEAGSVTEPCAGEVVVEQDGEWHSALVLRRNGDRYLIHTCPGYNSAVLSGDNIEWVKADRIRFPVPASLSGQDESFRGSADSSGAFGAAPCCSQSKKGPVPAEV
jgi:hypothetical protein